MRLFFCMCFATLLMLGASEAKNTVKLKCSIDKLVYLPAAYQVASDDLEGLFDKGNYRKNPYFEWLTLKKTELYLRGIDLKVLKSISRC